MSKNLLLQALRNNAKTGDMFTTNATFTAYKTGFPALDYAMGFNVNVYDDSGNVKTTYPSIGITCGSIVTIVGKTHVGKTTLATQLASSIVRPFDNGFVLHFDLEGGTNMTRISTLSRFTPQELKDGKYIVRQLGVSIEEIKKTIAELYRTKTANPDDYKYDTGEVDEFGEKVYAYVPTVIIIDSVASMTSYINENTKDGQAEMDTISSQTDSSRFAGLMTRFLKEIMQMLKAANIILILINHIKDKISMGVPQPAEMRGLKQNETLPAGKALQYYTNTMIRLTSIGSEHYDVENNGFDGFGVAATFIKNRSNSDGVSVPLVFDKVHGYDSIRSSVNYAKQIGLLGGNINGYYFGDRKDMKFPGRTIHEAFNQNKELYKVMYDTIIPVLHSKLSTVSPEEILVDDEELNY